MLVAVKGIIRGNKVIIENEDMREYDGAEVVVTLLDYPNIVKKKKKLQLIGIGMSYQVNEGKM